MDKIGFAFNTRLNALICLLCNVIVIPDHLDSHLKSLHNHPTASYRKTIQHIPHKFTTMKELPALFDHEPLEFKGLHTEQGFKCPNARCFRGYTTKKSAKAHFISEHTGDTLPDHLPSIYMQRFSKGPGNDKAWFVVRRRYEDAFHSFAGELEGLLARAEEITPVAAEKLDPRLVGPWLLSTGWHLHIDKFKKEDLLRLIAHPKTDERWGNLAKGLESYSDACLGLMSTTSHLALRRLNTSEPLKEYVKCFDLDRI